MLIASLLEEPQQRPMMAKEGAFLFRIIIPHLQYDDAEHLAKLVAVTQRAYVRNAVTGGYVQIRARSPPCGWSTAKP